MPKTDSSLLSHARTLRKNMTKEERHLWYDFLRTYPVKFCRQKPIGYYIADFYCAKAGLVIELDGSQHYTEEGKKYDWRRTEYMAELGIYVLRIPNSEVNRNFQGVCEWVECVVRGLLP